MNQVSPKSRNHNPIGSVLFAVRTSQRLTLREVAQLAGVSFGYLSQVERGQCSPSSVWLRAITEALGKRMAGVA